MVKLNKSKSSGTSGPSSAIGIMRFSDSDKTNLKLSPIFILVLAVIFCGAIIWLKATGL
ncbi:MAG: preprotein translocase subunit Sec61beta [Candidatus Diapherotrites archaeon]|nr:preprotein translocase subunit Sec61beta [Candidatus Diapherotrites archaeon]